jgi:hypothetical protein
MIVATVSRIKRLKLPGDDSPYIHGRAEHDEGYGVITSYY